MMDELFFYSLMGIALGITSFIKGLKNVFLKRMIENIPASKVRSIAMGLVEVYGEAVPIKILESPMSGEKCAYWRIEVEKADEPLIDIKNRLRRKLGWGRQVMESSERFYLKDETGSVLVDSRGAEMGIESHESFQTGDRKMPKELAKLLASKISRKWILGEKEMIYTEYVIKPKDRIYVLGTASRKPDAGLSPRHTESIIIRKGKNEQVFYISDKSKRDTVSRLGPKTFSWIVVGAALAVLCGVFAFFSFLIAVFI